MYTFSFFIRWVIISFIIAYKGGYFISTDSKQGEMIPHYSQNKLDIRFLLLKHRWICDVYENVTFMLI